MTSHRWLLPRRSGASRAADQQGDQRPRAAPQGHADRRGRLQADHAHRRLVSDADQAERRARRPTGSRRSRRPASAPRTAPSAPPTCSCSPPASQTHGFVAPMEIAGAGGRTLAEEWAEVPRAYLGLSVPGFPNMFLLYGPNTNGGTGSVIYTIEAAINHVIAALRELERADARRIEVAPRGRRGASTASCAPRWPAPSGTPAARTGTSTRTATTRTSGRGCGAPTGAAPAASSRAPTSWPPDSVHAAARPCRPSHARPRRRARGDGRLGAGARCRGRPGPRRGTVAAGRRPDRSRGLRPARRARRRRHHAGGAARRRPGLASPCSAWPVGASAS